MNCSVEREPASTSALRRYPAYRESFVKWLGEVPAHWEVTRLKSLVSNVVEQTVERRETERVVALENVESWTGGVRHTGSDSPYDGQLKRFRAGDVLFGKLRPYLAKVARLGTGGFCVGEFLVLRPRGAKLREPYLEHLLRSRPIIEAVTSSTFGAKMPRADWRFIGGMRVVCPPPCEQAGIVRFLNHADGRIRRYIRAKEKLITLLEEQRQGIVHAAVTGAINVRTGRPYPTYKDSGVEWLGRFPRHWEL